MSESRTSRVLIVGGGITGGVLSLALSQRGVEVVLRPDGSLKSVQAARPVSEFVDDRMEACVQSVVKTLSFAPNSEGKESTVTYPFTFTPGGNTVVSGPWNVPQGGPTPLEQAELDVLLDRISAGGIDSLTPHEKERLNALSKRMRDS